MQPLKKWDLSTVDLEDSVGENWSMFVGGNALQNSIVVCAQHASVCHPVAIHSTPRVEIGYQKLKKNTQKTRQ